MRAADCFGVTNFRNNSGDLVAVVARRSRWTRCIIIGDVFTLRRRSCSRSRNRCNIIDLVNLLVLLVLVLVLVLVVGFVIKQIILSRRIVIMNCK